MVAVIISRVVALKINVALEIFALFVQQQGKALLALEAPQVRKGFKANKGKQVEYKFC